MLVSVGVFSPTLEEDRDMGEAVRLLVEKLLSGASSRMGEKLGARGGRLCSARSCRTSSCVA